MNDLAVNPQGIIDSKSYNETISFAIVMIIYNHIPDLSSLLIGSKYAKVIILINNNSSPQVTQELMHIAEKIGDKCILLQNSSNKGVSKAYNEAISDLDDTIDYVLLLDHDAIFGDELFNEIFIALDLFKSKNIGVIVPIVADDKSLMKSNLGIHSRYSFVHSTITSGIFINRHLFLKVGGFNEDLFVEGADYELTRRIADSGYLLARINLVLIIQDFERPINNNGFFLSLFNMIIKYRSLIRIKFQNCNIYRIRLSFYSESREKELFRNLKKLRTGTLFNKVLISLVIFLDFIEITFVKIINKVRVEGGIL